MATSAAPHIQPAEPCGWISTPVQFCDRDLCGGPHWSAYEMEEFRCDACGMTTVHCTPIVWNDDPGADFWNATIRGTVSREDHQKHHAFAGCDFWKGGR